MTILDFADRRRSRRAFTLIELLVVVGIIVLLAAILIPMVLRTYRQAGKIRIQADFQTIALALDAYKTDFGDIPRVDSTAFPDTGAAVLGKALLGRFGDGKVPAGTDDTSDPITHDPNKPYDAGDVVRVPPAILVALTQTPIPSGSPTATGDRWAAFDPRDGADGPGFRTVAGGKVYGPYLAAGKINSRGTFLLDHIGGPILYFPTRPGRTNVTSTNLLSDGVSHAYIDGSPLSYINSNDNLKILRRLPDETGNNIYPEQRLRLILGDWNANGVVDADTNGANAEKAISQPYVLISPGANGMFGPPGYQPPVGTLTKPQVDEVRKLLERDDDATNVQ